jgi:hypothetical protein
VVAKTLVQKTPDCECVKLVNRPMRNARPVVGTCELLACQ